MRINFVILLILTISAISLAQPPRQPGPPPGGGQGPPKPDWAKTADTDKNGSVDAAEFQAAIDRTFAELDKNGNGTIDAGEVHFPPRGENGPPQGRQGGGQNQGQRPGQPGMQGPPMGQGGGQPGMQGPPMGRGDGQQGGRPGGRGGQPGGMNQDGQQAGRPEGDARFLPPFFFSDLFKEGAAVTKADFERKAKEVFAAMDANHDGVLSREESKPPSGPGQGGPQEGPPPPPNAMFIGAELRFGDKLVTGQPFSADTVIEDTHRLFDGSTVTKKNNGAIYRDGAGRTRREQPLDMVGNFAIANGQNKPQKLIFINDFAAKTQYFVDTNNKVARKSRIGQGGPPPGEKNGPSDAKTESLGTKTIEGVSVEGTRITFEIPVGQIGNDKPIQVVTENWFSPELQVMVMSRHTDPMAGEHVFKLTNIKRAEPAADLFAVPSGFRVEGPPDGARNEK